MSLQTPTCTKIVAAGIAVAILVACAGCRGTSRRNQGTQATLEFSDVSESVPVAATDIYPDYPAESVYEETLVHPLTNKSELPAEFVDISLDDAIAIALSNVEVLRSLAATVVQNTQGANTTFDPAIQSTDPNFGVEAALSAFDTSLNSALQYSNLDDTFNNASTTGSANVVQQNLVDFTFGLDKVTAAGTQLSLDSNLTYTDSTNPALLFPTAFDTSWQASVRQPLLQGRGSLFNRIAGPTSAPGFLGGSGFLISRSNHDISVVEFERNVNRMILEIINAYWQLDLECENFASIKVSRDASQETWNISKARFNNGLPGGEADREAQARAQFYQFQSQLTQSLTRVLQAEADFRRLLGLPQSDARFYRPSDSPQTAESVFDWSSMASKALEGRPELRQQRKLIEQRQLLLIASKSFTQPRLDAIATYRNNGFGDNLFGTGPQFSGALNEAFDGNFDEWEFGLTLDTPLGFRRAQAGVRNAELQLMRERAVLAELKSQILHDLGSAVRTVDQGFDVLELSQLGAEAFQESVDSRTVAYRADSVGFEDLLDAQQRLLDAQLAFHVAKTDYELAIAQVQFESSQLLREYAINLAEDIPPSSSTRANDRRNRIRKSSQNGRLRQYGFLR
ncbi:TolC family protein [Mariniblastus sp.]|nr:TolC family protein [Mariniblastus sp.]